MSLETWGFYTRKNCANTFWWNIGLCPFNQGGLWPFILEDIFLAYLMPLNFMTFAFIKVWQVKRSIWIKKILQPCFLLMFLLFCSVSSCIFFFFGQHVSSYISTPMLKGPCDLMECQFLTSNGRGVTFDDNIFYNHSEYLTLFCCRLFDGGFWLSRLMCMRMYSLTWCLDEIISYCVVIRIF